MKSEAHLCIIGEDSSSPRVHDGPLDLRILQMDVHITRQARYVLDLFKNIYGLTDSHLPIHYGIDNESPIQIRKNRTNIFKIAEPIDPKRFLWKTWKDHRIPFLFDGEDRPLLETTGEQWIINFDIIASSFYFLSGWDEITCARKNAFGKRPFEESIQARLSIIDIPVVNFYFDILKFALENACSMTLSVRHWGGHDFGVCITHDIDRCESAWKEGSYRELRKGKIGSPFKLISNKLFSRDAWFNFENIMDLENELGIHSTFFFLCRKGKISGLHNADYRITNRKFVKVLDDITKQGSEIGIHGGIGAHMDPNRLKEEVRRIPVRVLGNRFHHLHYDMKSSTAILEAMNLVYDSSLGFPEHYGFRNGICHPFPLYDVQSDRPSSILEIPLHLMDTTLRHKKYMGLDRDRILESVTLLIREIRRFQGCFTLLWHNNYFSEYKYAGFKELFIDIVQICRENNGRFLTCKDVWKKFRMNPYASAPS